MKPQNVFVMNLESDISFPNGPRWFGSVLSSDDGSRSSLIWKQC